MGKIEDVALLLLLPGFVDASMHLSMTAWGPRRLPRSALARIYTNAANTLHRWCEHVSERQLCCVFRNMHMVGPPVLLSKGPCYIVIIHHNDPTTLRT